MAHACVSGCDKSMYKARGGAFVLGQGANEEQNILHLTNA